MKLAEYCNTASSYIGEIEIGRKFPSVEMIEKIAKVLKVEPYHLFRDRTVSNRSPEAENVYPLLPKALKAEIKSQIDLSIGEILSKY